MSQLHYATAQRDAADRILSIRIKLGYKSQEAFAAAAQVSESTVRRIENGENARRSSYARVAVALGIEPDELLPETNHKWTSIDKLNFRDTVFACDAVLDRLAGHYSAIQRYWLAPEATIDYALGSFDAMVDDVRRVSTLLDRLDLRQRRSAGLLAAELMGCVWSFRGPNSMAKMVWLHRFAGYCAVSIEFKDDGGAAQIQGIRTYNRLGMAPWCQPNMRLRSRVVPLLSNNFDESVHHFSRAGMIDPETYKTSAVDVVEQKLHGAQIYIQGGKRFASQALAAIEEAESVAAGGHPVLRAHVLRTKGAYAEMMNDIPAAIDFFQQAMDQYERVFGTTMHYTYASCGMRIRGLGKPLRTTLDHDLNVLSRSAIRYTDIVNLDTTRQTHSREFERRQKNAPCLSA